MARHKKLGFIDLFCGCGGLSLGFLQAGFRQLIALDNDPKAVACYNRNLKQGYGARAINLDLTSITSVEDVARMLESSGVDVSDCDVIIGGPPCQSFSVVGRNKIKTLMKSDSALKAHWEAKDRQRVTLFEVYAHFLEAVQPAWFLFENVPTIVSHPYFPRIVNRFETLVGNGGRLDYSLTYDNYLASDFGVPQTRKRFFMVGRRSDKNRSNWERPKRHPVVTVSQALGDLPAVAPGAKERRVHYRTIAKSSYQRLMRSGKNGRGRGIVLDHICRWHNADDVELFRQMRCGARFADTEVQVSLASVNPDHKLLKYSTDKFRDKLHKLHPAKPAWTVTAHLQKDCYKFIHHSQSRTITVREAARLQSFPDWFSFEDVSMVTAFGLTGNAVPPLMAKRFADSILSADQCISRKVTGNREVKSNGWSIERA